MTNQIKRRNFLSTFGLSAVGTAAVSTPVATISKQDDKLKKVVIG